MTEHAHNPRRRGGVYVLVLVTVAVVAAMIVASLDIVRARSAEGVVLADSVQAWQCAESAMERGMHLIQSEPAWRWARGDGAWLQDQAYGNGRISIEVTGADGAALSPDAWQPVRLTGIGVYGRARAIMRVDLGIQGEGFPTAGALLYANDLKGYWPLADGAASFAADRVSGNAAQIVADPSYFRPGAVPALGAAAAPWFSDNAALELDYRSAYDGTRSISLWLYADDVMTKCCVGVRDGGGYDDGCWAVALSGGRVYGAFESEVAQMVTSAPISAGGWHHVVLVAEDTRVVLYLDGAQADRVMAVGASYWFHDDARDIYLGQALSSASSGMLSGFGPYRGSICEVALVGDALSATEVQTLYDAYPAPAAYKALADTWNRDVR